MLVLSPGPGTDGNHSCGFGALRRRTRTPPPPFLCLVNDPAFHAAGDSHDLAGDVSGDDR